MSLIWQPPQKSVTITKWNDEPDWSIWAEPGIPVETHKALIPVWIIGVAFWVIVGVTVFIGRRLGL